MASVAYSGTNNIDRSVLHQSTKKEIPVCLVCSETTSSIPSVDRLVRGMKCQSSH